jgi:VanZ family protein
MFLKYNWPGLCCLAIILILTGVPGNYMPTIQRFWDWLGPDKIAHLIMYGTFVYLLLRGFSKQTQFAGLQANFVIYAMLIGIIFGAFTEVMQRYVFTGRNANIYDFLANVAGCFAGLAVYYLINRKLKKIFKIINN